jgi:putative ABC transport system permease protein
LRIQRRLQARNLMRPSALVGMYRDRLRVHAAQELLAGLGVAIAVALVFATLVANGSITGSAAEVIHAVVGPASLQIRARGEGGFPEALLTRVEESHGVKAAAPLLEQTATVGAPNGRHTTVILAGTDVSLATLNGLAHTLPIDAISPGAISLSRLSADQLGLGRGSPGRVSLELRGASYPLKVSAVLGASAIGALSRAGVAIMPLETLQHLAGLSGRVSSILVQTQPGDETAVRHELETLAGGQLAVVPADNDLTLLGQALRPSDQATAAFAAISVLLGFLFAFNAMLLTIPERRQVIADLRVDGTRRSAIAQMVLFEALSLGLLASIIGLFVGYGLSVSVLHQSTGYLAQAFTLASTTQIGAQPLILALVGGVIATCAASMIPLLDLRGRVALDAVYFEEGSPGNALGRQVQRRLFLLAVVLLVLASALFVAIPSAALAALVLLALATVLSVPLVLAGILLAGETIARSSERLTTLPVALTSLRATTLRSLALAATSALALFGSIALGGARSDLLRGIGRFAHSYSSDANIWVANPGDNQATDQFRPDGDISRITGVPGVRSVSAFQGGFLELGSRRVWVIARPPGGEREVLSTQLVDGNLRSAVAHLGLRGWMAVSQQVANERHVHLGGTLTLPTPSGPASFRVIATTTNLAWSPGVIFMSTADFTRLWKSTEPTALAIDLTPGTSVRRAVRAVQQALGAGSGLEASSAASRQTDIDKLTGEGLSQLGEISTLLIVAAILAMAAALGSSIWQQRTSMAGLRLEGAQPRRLRRLLATESTLMIAAGCVTGVLAGIYGEVVIDGYLRHVTAFPVRSIAASARPIEILALVVVSVLLIVALPAWLATRVSPSLALEDE